MLSTDDQKARESRLRGQLARRGYALRKDRRHHTRGLERYAILDPFINGWVAGMDGANWYDFDLDDVEAWLADE